MDATNRAIIAQLSDIAKNFFNSLELAPGTYTAAELAANMRTGDKTKRAIYIIPGPDAKPTDEADELAARYYWEPLTIAAGSFVCEIPRALVFRYLWQFEQLERVPQKEKARFTREVERPGALSFYCTIEKDATAAAKFTAVDELRPAMMQIYIDIERAALVATDTHILGAWPIEIEEAEAVKAKAAETGQKCYINPKHIKNLVGRVCVTRYEEDGQHITEITNEAGEVYKCELKENYNFPNWERVLPQLSAPGYIQVTPEGVKTASKFIKQLTKEKNPAPISFAVVEGEAAAVLTYRNPDYCTAQSVTIPLEAPANCTVTFGLDPDYISNVLPTWNGAMWLTEPSRPLMFECWGAAAVIAMPRNVDDATGGVETREAKFNALERENHLPSGIVPPTRKNAPKRKKTAKIDTIEAAPVVEETTAPTEEQIIAFVDALAAFLDNVVKSFYRAEIDKTISRLKELAELAGLELADVLADAMPMPEVEATPPPNLEAAPILAAAALDEPRTDPAMFRRMPPKLMPAAEVCALAMCGRDAPPGDFRAAVATVSRPGATPPRGMHRIRDGTNNNIPNNFVNFVIHKYCNSS